MCEISEVVNSIGFSSSKKLLAGCQAFLYEHLRQTIKCS